MPELSSINYTKQNLIDDVAKETSISKVTSRSVITSVINQIKKSLSEKKSIRFLGVGRLKIMYSEPRKVRNPWTGEDMDLPVRFYIRWQSTPEFKKLINDKISLKLKKNKKQIKK